MAFQNVFFAKNRYLKGWITVFSSLFQQPAYPKSLRTRGIYRLLLHPIEFACPDVTRKYS